MEFKLQKVVIKGYKILRDELVLDNLGKVNYLVGENGSGKSSIIELLAEAVSPNNYSAGKFNEGKHGTVRNIFAKEFRIVYQLLIGGSLVKGEISLSQLEYDQGKVSFNEVSNDGAPLKNRSAVDTSLLNVVSSTGTYFNTDALPDGVNEQAFKQLLNRLKFFELDILDVSRSPHSDPSIHLTLSNQEKKNLKSLSTGQLALLHFYFRLYDKMATMNKGILNIICLDEPELHLHPKYQKLLPILLDELTRTQENVVFFIATHSPFIVSESRDYEYVRTFILDRGKLVEGEKEQYSTLVAKMLGADKVDLGYSENFCLLEEASFYRLLTELQKRGIIKPWAFLSCSGVDKVPQYANTMTHVAQLLNCNPFYFDSFYIIIDSLPEEEVNKRAWIKTWKEKLNKPEKDPRFIMLEKSNLEDYYPIDLLNSFRDECAKTGANQGIIKDQYAKRVAETINTAEDFKSLFNNELDFLLS